jgi:hypothetical protein
VLEFEQQEPELSLLLAEQPLTVLNIVLQI